MNRITLLVAALAVTLAAASPTSAKIRVVTSTTDLASIASMIGGENVDVKSIARGKSNLHFVEVLPSHMIKVKKADLYLMLGMDVDRWAQKIIDGSRNGRLKVIDCSQGITPLGVPMEKVDASMGDIHPSGNPHYWLDPDNGLIVAGTVRDALMSVDADNATAYQENFERFRSTLAASHQRWAPLAQRVQGLQIVSYHDTWPYFSRAFGVEVVGFIEPKPGIEPTPSHTARLVSQITGSAIGVIGVEPYYSTRTPEAIARDTGARMVVMPTSVGAVDHAGSYFDLFDALLQILIEAGGR